MQFLRINFRFHLHIRYIIRVHYGLISKIVCEIMNYMQQEHVKLMLYL